MKNSLVILITILVIALMGFTTFAANGDSSGDDDPATHDRSDDNGGDRTTNDDSITFDLNENNGGTSYTVLLEDYRQLLDLNRENLELRLELMKKIVDLKKISGDDSISAFIDGSEVEFDVPPVIRSSRTLIPVRAVTTALGAQVDWTPSEPNIVKITKTLVNDTGSEELKVIIINLDTDKVTVNGVATELDVPPMLIGNRTMVPVRFIAEAFSMKINWDTYVGGIVIDR